MENRSSFSTVALSVAMAVSTLTWAPGILGLPGRSGFLLAGTSVAVAWVFNIAFYREWLARNLKRHRYLGFALIAVVLSKFVSVIGAQEKSIALAQSIRVAAILGFFLLVLFENQRSGNLRKVLALCALIVIAVNTALLFTGLISDAVFSYLFEAEHHLHLNNLPRFIGETGGPFAVGFTMLACTGLLGYLPQPRLRIIATMAGLALCIATFSFASLLVPIVIFWRFLRQKIIRTALVVVAALLAIGILYIHPLELATDENSHEVGSLHPYYSMDGLGEENMPIKALTLGDYSASFHFTGYYYLAKRSLLCFKEHPLNGVGGRNHPYSCQVRTMTSLGNWTQGRIAHNEYTGLFAEYGLIGIMATLGFLFVLLRKYRFVSDDPWIPGIVVAYLISGFAGEVWYQFPFVALLGVSFTLAANLAKADPIEIQRAVDGLKF